MRVKPPKALEPRQSNTILTTLSPVGVAQTQFLLINLLLQSVQLLSCVRRRLGQWLSSIYSNHYCLAGISWRTFTFHIRYGKEKESLSYYIQIDTILYLSKKICEKQNKELKDTFSLLLFDWERNRNCGAKDHILSNRLSKLMEYQNLSYRHHISHKTLCST